MTYVLDTHVWIWWHMNPDALSKKIRRLIGDPTQYDELLLSAISPWEFCKLIDKGRLGICCDPEDWMNQALDMPKMRVVPLTPRIAFCSTTLPQPFHSDPADQIIVATAREERAILLTKDERLRRCKAVKCLW